MTNAVSAVSLPRHTGALLALAACHVACVTNSNLCLPGYVYSSQYDACLAIGGDAEADAGADDAATEAATATDGGMSDAGSAAGDAGLGSSCNTSSDCSGQASYCLKDPTASPSAPGICTIPGCTAAECTSAYSCCDCTQASLSSLTAWPKNVCTPSSNETTLVALGCTCQ
jgi:hypothetical protein